MQTQCRHVGKRIGVAVFWGCVIAWSHAGEWPMVGHDLPRSGVTDEQLSTPLHLQWSHLPTHGPRPAWPEPGRELNRMAFDYAYAVTASNGLAFFGSSADHKVYALDLRTGSVRWSFFTGGPVRFAPVVAGERVFAASDDGHVYCLAASDGRELWRLRVAPEADRIIGNEQMISRWPIRSGVLVDGDTVYVCAGMWPSEGVYLYALNAGTGDIVWRTVDEGMQYKKQPHPPSEAFLGMAPQGYMIGDSRRLAIPTGRNMPAVYDRQTGAQLHYRSAPRDWGTRWGGAWCQLVGEYLVTWNNHFQPDVEVMPGEFKPDPKDGMWFFDADTGRELRELRGKLCAVMKDGMLYASGNGRLSAYPFDSWIKPTDPKAPPRPKWEVPLGRTYVLIAAGETLFAGGRDTVTAIASVDGSLLWKSAVDGEVRFLAAAEGRLLVSTTTGRIACFGSEPCQVPAVTRTVVPKPRPIPAASTALARRLLAQTGKTSGFCLTLGGGEDGHLPRALAAEPGLVVHCAEPDPERVRQLRLLLDADGLYGERVVVHSTPYRQLAFPNYFADLIVGASQRDQLLTRWSAEGIYRVLRPNGGRACFSVREQQPEGGTESIRRWLLDGNVPEKEISVVEGAVLVTRGALPGAGQWTHQYGSAGRPGASDDTRARVPLHVLWFGKPGPSIMVARHWRGPAPLYSNGRMFVIGQRELVCVDAYNGREIWRRDLGTKNGKAVNLARWPVDVAGSSVAADETSVYIATGKSCLRLDAATGETLTSYQVRASSVPLPGEQLASAKWQHLALVGDTVVGSLGEGTVGRCVAAVERDSGATRWTYATAGSVGINALAVDSGRIYLLDGATPGEFQAAKRRGHAAAAPLAVYALDLKTGEPVWHLEKKVAGATDVRVARGVVLVTGRRLMTGVDAGTGDVLYSRTVGVPKMPVIVGDTVYIQPYAYDLRTGANRMTTHPFTGQEAPWTFTRSYGCGQITGSPNLLVFRSGTLGFYDLAGDSGTHNFAGIRAGCSTNVIAAGGLLMSAPADASCTCSYSFRTTLALAPSEQREQWGLMYTALPVTPVRHVALNFGAPGDHRDTDGTLWMAAPHPSVYNARPGHAAPFEYEFDEGGGPHRSAPTPFGQHEIERPWLYNTSLRGLRKATFDLTIFRSGYLSWPVRTPPRIDGTMTDACWDGYKAVPLNRERATVTLRHDKQNLYLCYAGRAATDTTGAPTPWRTAVTEEDGEIWRDTSFEAFLSPPNRNWREPSKRYVHLGVSASGARYDALWEYSELALPVLAIPPVHVTVDGDIADWGERGLRVQSLPGPKGKLRSPSDLDASCRLGWTPEGVAVLIDVSDSVIHEEANPTQLWWGDSVEIFFTAKPGTKDFVQTAISPGVDGAQTVLRHRFYDERRDRTVKLQASFAGVRTDTGWRIEMLWPWKNLGITPADGTEFGLQVFVNDDDGRGRDHWFRARWHPYGHPAQKPRAFQTLRLAASPSSPIRFTRREKPGADGLFDAAEPVPFPVTEPSEMGAKGEDCSYSVDWESAVKVDGDSFVAEWAIPWAALSQAGIDRGGFMVDISSRGPLRVSPVSGRGFQPVVCAPDHAGQERTVSLRLHFAGEENVEPGARVADIKIQGKTVLAGLDVVREAGGSGRPLVKEISGLRVGRTLRLEIEPRPGSERPPVNGIEISAEPH